MHLIQRTISYKRGGFTDREELAQALKKQFAAQHHEKIEWYIGEYEKVGGHARFASEVFQKIATVHAVDENWQRADVKKPSEGHGPQLMTTVGNRLSATYDQVMSTVTFSTVTLAKVDLESPDGTKVSYEERNSEGEHAEERLIPHIAKFYQSRHGASSSDVFRLTINNLPCGTGPGEHNCSQQLASFITKVPFKRVHVYYSSAYGADPKGAIERLQSAGAMVSSYSTRHFVPEEKLQLLNAKIRAKLKQKPVSGVKDDAWSDDESDTRTEQTGGSHSVVGVGSFGLAMFAIVAALIVLAAFFKQDVQQLARRFFAGEE